MKVNLYRLGRNMTVPISQLANMEFQLYGGALGANQNCPSYVNGYRASSNSLYGNYYNQYGNPYWNNRLNNYYNNAVQKVDNFQKQQNQAVSQKQSVQSNAQTKSVVSKDIETLADYYKDVNTYTQKWGDLGTGALMVGFMENAQVFKHPINSIRAIGVTNKVFDKSNPVIQALWKKNPELMQKAYGQLHAVNRMAQPKFSVIQKWFQKPIDEATRKQLEKIMSDAIKTGDEKAILKATEALRASRGMDGYLPSLLNKITGGKNYTPLERIANNASEIEKTVNKAKALKPGVTGLLKQGFKEGKTVALIGMLMDCTKIISAYKNGGIESALTQSLQTGAKSIADCIGWTIGRAAGTAIGTKVGAAIGTAVCPGVGTAVGAVIGFIGGTAGSILASKAMKIFIPTDESVKLEANAKKKTAEGQTQLLSLVLQNAQAGEKVPEKVLVSAQNVANTMSA